MTSVRLPEGIRQLKRRQFNFLKNVVKEFLRLRTYVVEKRKIFNADLKLIKMLERKNSFDQKLFTSKKRGRFNFYTALSPSILQ